MKIFEGTPKGDYGEKVNFVDDNNVFVGYDMEQDCCEQADWFIADEVAVKMPEKLNNGEGLEGYSFDPNYMEEKDSLEYSDMEENSLDEGGMVVFRLFGDGADKFLHLFNCHNGYYGHGFTFKIGDTVKHEGCL